MHFKGILGAAAFFGALFLVTTTSYAYEGDTHAYLTDEAVKFFDKFSTSTPLDPSLKDFLTDGSRHEDSVPRWMNHFYDPVHGMGLSDSLLGDWETSKGWADDGNNQNKLLYKAPSTISSILSAIQKKKLSEISSDTDFTWREAIRHYIKGEKESAMYTLGHVLHLIEDASVPDHTRNDPHPGDSPYENWTQQFTLAHPDPELEHRLEGKTPPYFNGLGVYFDSLAEYSNSNFYSRDTVGIQSGYNFPEPSYFDFEKDGKKYAKKTDAEFGDYPLARVSGVLDSDSKELINRPVIMSSYWSRLSTKSVQYAAGVITLFFKEAEAASKNPAPTVVEEKSFLGNMSDTVGNFFGSIIGTIRSAFSRSSDRGNDEVTTTDETDAEYQNEKDTSTAALATSPTIFSDKQVARRGETIVIKGVHFGAKSGIVLHFESLFVSTSTSVVTDVNGGFTENVYVGQEFIGGNYTISAEDASGVVVGNKIIVSVLNFGREETEEQETNSSTVVETANVVVATSSQERIQPTIDPPKAGTQYSFAVSATPSYAGVLLNEIAWMGSTENANAEWIELKNISAATINISGWQLVDKGEQIKVIFPEGTVLSAGGLYLLERTNDDAVPHEKADLIYSGALSNSNEELRLFDAGCALIDEVFANPSWPAGDVASRRTMERETNRSWHTFGGTATNNILGTPKRQNGQALVVYSGGGGGGGGGVTSGGGNNSGGGSSSTPTPAPTSTSTSTSTSSSTPTPPVPHLRINEVMYDAPGADVSHEWIEIINDGTSTASLAGVKLLEGSSHHTLTLARGTNELLRDEYAIIADNASTFIAEHVSTDVPVFDSAFSLNNDGELLRLVMDDRTIDSFSYTSSSGADGSGDSLQYFSDGWEAALPTPGAENVKGVHASSTEGTGESNSPPSLAANDVVISEVLFDAEGTDEGKEFVELYNPANQEKDLSNWSLRYSRGSATTTESLAVFGGSSEGNDRTVIPAYGFLLVGLNGYDSSVFGIEADIKRSAVLLNGGEMLSDSVRLSLINQDGSDISAVRYNANSISSPGESIERRAWKSGTCVSAQDTGEFLGNGCAESGSGSFGKRQHPRPQNSKSLPEPRTPPEFATSSVSAILSEDGLNVEISWERTPNDDNGDGLYYEISDAESEAVFQKISGTHRWADALDEVGKVYTYRVRLSDRDGLGSDYGTVQVETPSFFSDLLFYENASGTPVADMRFEQYPFIPDAYWDHTNTSWKAVVLYLNGAAEREEFLSITNDFIPQSANAIKARYVACAGNEVTTQRIILPDTADRCSTLGGGLYPVSLVLPEDRRLVFPIEVPSVTSHDYLTVALYSFYESGESTRFKLVATDAKQYHFQATPPPSLPPSPPEGMQVEFNNFHSFIKVSPGVSRDEDSPDSALSYEVRVTRDDESLSTDAWRAIPAGGRTSFDVDHPHSYLVESRARDGDGNTSDPATFLWSFPASYIPLPFQRHREEILRGAAEQLITITHDVNVNGVAMWLGADGGVYCCSKSKLVIYEDNEGAHGTMIAASAPQSLSAVGYDNALNAQWEIIYEFSSPFYLQAGKKYWLSIEGTGESSNPTRVYGSAVDAYQYGHWKGDDWKDAYFYLRQAL